MTIAHTIQEALEHPETVTELHLNAEEAAKPICGDLTKLTQLRTLAVQGPPDGSLPFPAELLTLQVAHVDLRHFRAYEIFPMQQLKSLTLVSHFVQDDLLPLCRKMRQLETLEIMGLHATQSMTLPPQIARLEALRSLTIAGTGMTMLPNELIELKRLRTLGLRDHTFTEFPEALTQMALESLEFSDCLAAPGKGRTKIMFPDLSAMTALKHLDLSSNFGGTAGAGWLDFSFTKEPGFPAPAALATLPSVESLDLSHCHLDDIAALAPLRSLRKLHLSSNPISDLTPISELTHLEELELGQCERLSSLEPLRRLTLLRKLSLEAGRSIRDASPIGDLPALQELNIEGCERLTNVRAVVLHPNIVKLEAEEQVMTTWRSLS